MATVFPPYPEHAVENIRSPHRKKVLILILSVSLFKLFFAFLLELGNDEAYYWLYSQYLQWNYFDHPPMVAIWIRLFTADLLLQDYEGFIRMGSVIGSAVASWFMYKAAACLHSEKAGWYAALLYHASFYASITAGLYILPDTPQMVFWTFSLWRIAKLAKDEGSWINWIAFGIGAGLCIMSKVHGVFLWVGIISFSVFKQRSWLVKPKFYLALFISLVITSPIFFWNLQHDFITYRFHSERVAGAFHFEGMSFFKELSSQFLFNNPINVFLLVLAFIQWRKKRLPYLKILPAYVLVGLPLALLLLFISMFRNTVLPHWSGPAYVSMIPLTAIYLAERKRTAFPRILRWALGLMVGFLLSSSLLILFYQGTYGSKSEKDLGKGDMTLDMYGWKDAGREFASFYKKDLANGMMPSQTPLVFSHWAGAHVEYYFGRPLGVPVIGLSDPKYLHQYWWTNHQRVKQFPADSAYCIITSNKPFQLPVAFYRKMELATIIHIFRGGKPAHDFYVYRMKGLKKRVPEAER